MGINFNSLPTDKPQTTIPEGTYYATVEEAVMKQPKDMSKPEYLNIKLSLKDKAGKRVGNIFDSLFDSEAPLLQYKLSRFIKAVEIEFNGTFDLKDLAKVIKNKELILDAKVEKQEGYQDKTIVDLFSGEIYYKLAEAKELFGESVKTETEEVKPAKKAKKEVDAESEENDEDIEF